MPSSWLNIDKNKCKYPPGPNVNIINVVKKCKAAKPAWPYLPRNFLKVLVSFNVKAFEKI